MKLKLHESDIISSGHKIASSELGDVLVKNRI